VLHVCRGLRDVRASGWTTPRRAGGKSQCGRGYPLPLLSLDLLGLDPSIHDALPVMARLDRATQYSPELPVITGELPVITGSPGLAFGSPEDDSIA
jgi:hypothetical protein